MLLKSLFLGVKPRIFEPEIRIFVGQILLLKIKPPCFVKPHDFPLLLVDLLRFFFQAHEVDDRKRHESAMRSSLKKVPILGMLEAPVFDS